jgi:hypothetical protein
LPVESSLHLHLENTLNAEIVNHTIQSMSDAVMYLSWTFLFQRAQSNPMYYIDPWKNHYLRREIDNDRGSHFRQRQLDQDPTAVVTIFFKDLVQTVLERLVKAGCCFWSLPRQQMHPRDHCARDAISATRLGQIASEQYLDVHTIHFLHRFLVEVVDMIETHGLNHANYEDEYAMNPTIILELLERITGCVELAQVAVRPHEESLYRAIASATMKVPFPRHWKWASDGSRMKCFLLLQLHLSRSSPQILDSMITSDISNDLRTMFDHIPRICAALVDISAHVLFRRDLTRASVDVSRMLFLGYWPFGVSSQNRRNESRLSHEDRDEWLQLPHVLDTDVASDHAVFKHLRLAHVLSHYARSDMEAILPRRLSRRQKQDCMVALESMPRMALRMTLSHRPNLTTQLVLHMDARNAHIASVVVPPPTTSSRLNVSKPQPHVLSVLISIFPSSTSLSPISPAAIASSSSSSSASSLLDQRRLMLVRIPFAAHMTRTISLPRGLNMLEWSQLKVEIVSNATSVVVLEQTITTTTMSDHHPCSMKE